MASTKTITKQHVDQLIAALATFKDAREAILNELDAEGNSHGHFPETFTEAQALAFNDVDTAVWRLERLLRVMKGRAE